MTEDTDVRQYWEARLKGGPALDTVGWLGAGRAFNRWMYRVRARLFIKRVGAAIKRARLSPQTMRVLDVGSGTGFYVDLWHRLGVRDLSGCDLTDAAVNALRQKYPRSKFVRMDIGEAGLPYAAGSFDALSCMDVLFHIVDDARYAQAIANCARLLRPGGLFVFSENCLHGPEIRSAHQVSRTLGRIEALLARANVTILDRRPAFVLLNGPVDAQDPVLPRIWNLLRFARHNAAFGWVAGMVLYPFELLLVSLLHEGPSTELLVCRRNDSFS